MPNYIVAYWLNETARVAWLWSIWLDDMASAFSETEGANGD